MGEKDPKSFGKEILRDEHGHIIGEPSTGVKIAKDVAKTVLFLATFPVSMPIWMAKQAIKRADEDLEREEQGLPPEYGPWR